jgi:hypothetical protein
MDFNKNTEQIDLHVYFIHSSADGPQLRIYDEDDLRARGGTHVLELELQCGSYWYSFLGWVVGERPAGGNWIMQSSALAALSMPAASAMHPGRCHPGFRAGDLERCIFDAIAEAIQAELDQWKQPDGGDINAYGFKDISITRDEVSSIAGVLRANRFAHCVLEIQVFKYWYDPTWGSGGVPDIDLITDEFAISIPFRVRWSTMKDRLVTADVLRLNSCYLSGPKQCN